jgi:lysophospholipid hydrolase
VKTLEEAKKSPNCLYMAIPVQEYATMGFNKFEEIQQKGYDAALEMIMKWEDESGGKLGFMNLTNTGTAANERKKGRARRSSI